MPVTSTEISSNYVGNGSTTVPYPITIPRDRDEDLKLLVDGVASTDFTVSPDGFRTGVAYANTVALVLYRETPLTQEQPFPSNTTPAAEDVRAGLNKVTLISQENKDGVDRSLKAPVGGTPPSGNISQKANTTLGQDASGGLVSRTVGEEVEHLGIGGKVDEANASAAASAASAASAAASAAALALAGAALKVDDLGALRGVIGSDNGLVHLLGSTNKGDNGSGLFYWDSASTETDNGGTIVKVTSLATGRWKRFLNGDLVNVAWFGAVGDGITDDTAAIKAAIDFANVSGIKTVFIPEGVHLVDIPTTENGGNFFAIEIHEDMHLRGGGYSSVLKLADNQVDRVGSDSSKSAAVVGNFNSNQGGGFGNGDQRCRVSDLAIDGNKANQTVITGGNWEGINFDGVRDGVVENCYIYNTTGDGIDFDRGERCVARGNLIIGAGGSGIHHSGGSYGVSDGNTTNACGVTFDRAASDSIGCNKVSLINNYSFEDNKGFETNAEDTLISNNYIVDITGTGGRAAISLESGCVNPTISNNVVNGGNRGVSAENGIARIKISDNRFIDVGSTCISMFSNASGGHSITGNYISMPDGTGASGITTNGPDNIISGNTFYNIRTSALLFGLNVDNTVVSNNVFDSPQTADSISYSGSGVNSYIGNAFINMGAYEAFVNAPNKSQIITGNINGPVTSNRGIATIPNGSTEVTVNHGLHYAMTNGEDVIVSPTNFMGNATKFRTKNHGATSFVIEVDADPGTDTAVFAWQAGDNH